MKNWIYRTAKAVAQFSKAKKGPNKQIVCASGITPSGSVHLGNLREIMTVHLIHQELLRQGHDAVHLHFWDDYDRLRKIPANVPQTFKQYLGRPLSEVPNPFGQGSYADHFIAEFQTCMNQIGVKPQYIRQSEVYGTTHYADMVELAINKRLEIFDILLKHQSEEKQAESIANRQNYYPFAVYSQESGTDDTQVLHYDSENTTLHYLCRQSGKELSFNIRENLHGKLVWKVDWPMRWTKYQVDFEPGGTDHSTPGSSYTVGKEIVKRIFNWHPPFYVAYAFISISGQGAKISSSTGTIATPSNALSVLEPAMIRWLYCRTDVRRSFKISFDDQIMRLYDEWDRFVRKNASPKAKDLEKFIFYHSTQTATESVPYSQDGTAFRILTSAYEMTKGSPTAFTRVVNSYTGQKEFDPTESRIQLAKSWVDLFMPDQDKISIRTEFAQQTFNNLPPQAQQAVKDLASRLQNEFTLESIQKAIYGVPKKTLGMPEDAKPTPELKAFQRIFYGALYDLFINRPKGPRLPTLIVAIGQTQTLKLLTP